MGARTLEARLTRRLVVLVGLVLVGLGVAAVVVTSRVLDASDTKVASAEASAARDALLRELGEGDAPEEALHEILVAAEGKGVLEIGRTSGHEKVGKGGGILADVPPATCRTVAGEQGRRFRACATGDEAASVIVGVDITEHGAVVRALERGMAAAVLVGLLALWLAVRQALRGPVAELTSLVGWTERILLSEKAAPPPTAATREIARLGGAFDVLVRRLLDALARARANSAHIAHELRTPLTSILAEVDALQTQDRGAVARIRGDVARLADVIDAILVLSDARAEIRSGAIVNVADLARALAPEGATVEAPDEALVEADERLVTLAMRNLLDNARKYGGGVRAVGLTREGKRLRLAVRDEGPGLSPEARERMFDRYWRGTADGEGSGLGLALVQAVAQRYGGKAEAAPGPGDRGLVVSLTFDGLVGWHEEPAAAR